VRGRGRRERGGEEREEEEGRGEAGGGRKEEGGPKGIHTSRLLFSDDQLALFLLLRGRLPILVLLHGRRGLGEASRGLGEAGRGGLEVFLFLGLGTFEHVLRDQLVEFAG
jgi:hypothetical protein